MATSSSRVPRWVRITLRSLVLLALFCGLIYAAYWGFKAATAPLPAPPVESSQSSSAAPVLPSSDPAP